MRKGPHKPLRRKPGPTDGAAAHEVECEACHFKGKKAGVDVKRRELLHTVGSVTGASLWKTVQRILKKLVMEPPYDKAIPLTGIYLYKAKS